MIVLVLNLGSSSLKAGLFETQAGQTLFQVHLEQTSRLSEMIETLYQHICDQGIDLPDAIGHRVVHGGPHFQSPTLVNDATLQTIEACIPLAPLHNPLNLRGLQATLQRWPEIPHVAVFDTSFHRTVPLVASTYAVPQKWRDLGIQRYGFHGISHQYISQQLHHALPAQGPLRIVNCHLGNGASICAIQDGRSIDTSMGFTALSGLVMGTRSGDLDPGIFGYLSREQGLSIEEIEQALYKDCGMKALSEISHDMRNIEDAAQQGDLKAKQALDIYVHRIRHYIGAYAVSMGGIDVLSFTGGVGQGSAYVRREVCKKLGILGIHLDQKKNQNLRLDEEKTSFLQDDHSTGKIAVMRTREEWMIAQETARLLQ